MAGTNRSNTIMMPHTPNALGDLSAKAANGNFAALSPVPLSRM
ncbi:MAG TPA: hypothetical protein VNK23_11055 [Candidatus Dormibacteraeota bacterium]|nr:hypothetical protein [Candidatus Dormibacteraeota bacterium]